MIRFNAFKGVTKSLVAGAVVALTLLAGGIAYASIPAANGVISGCYDKNGGTLRVIDAPGTTCNSAKELPLTWNQTGPQGPQGAKGDTGPQGPASTVPQAVTDFVNRFGSPNPATAGTDSSNPCTLGAVQLTAATRGVGVPAEGQPLPISQNAALFSLLGTRFGGDGVSTFRLPDLRGLAPDGLTYMICIFGSFPVAI